MDTARYARFLRPGHAVTGDRSQRSRNWMAPETRVGYDFAHAIIDDPSPAPAERQSGSAAGRSRYRRLLEHSCSVDFRQRNDSQVA